jgi:hypothetical protein
MRLENELLFPPIEANEVGGGRSQLQGDSVDLPIVLNGRQEVQR